MNPLMTIKKSLFTTLFFPLLTGCGLLGEQLPQYEVGEAFRVNNGLCFQIKNTENYYVDYLAIRNRDAPEMSGFNRQLPALTISKNNFCIPRNYYQFPAYGEINVVIALMSPTKTMMIRRYIVSEFRMVDGEPQPFTPREYSVPTADYMREKE